VALVNCLEGDTTTPPCNILQPPSQATPTQVSPTSTQAQAFDGPITCSRAKNLQQEVHVLLYEIHLNIHENYIQPKSCTLLLLRFTKEDDKYTPGEDYKEEPCSGQHSMTESSERISHHFLLPKAMKAHADLLESLSSLVSNATSSNLFGVFVWTSDLF
jgi:hypothetical protein